MDGWDNAGSGGGGRGYGQQQGGYQQQQHTTMVEDTIATAAAMVAAEGAGMELLIKVGPTVPVAVVGEDVAVEEEATTKAVEAADTVVEAEEATNNITSNQLNNARKIVFATSALNFSSLAKRKTSIRPRTCSKWLVGSRTNRKMGSKPSPPRSG